MSQRQQAMTVNPEKAHLPPSKTKLCFPCRKDDIRRSATRIVAGTPMCTAHAALAWKPSPLLAPLSFKGDLPDAD